MSKRLTKTIWYGSDVDSNGNPILPSTQGGLDGLNYGELFLHLSNGKATLWTLSSDGNIVEITGGGSEVDMSSYLLKSIWDKVFEIRTDSQGTEYIFGKLPVVTQYGITMYSGDGVDIPSLASGLPFDGRTIWYNPDTNQIEVIGGTGGGSGEGVSNFWDLSGIPSWITNSKPKYSYSEIDGTPDLTQYATESWVNTKLGGYLPLNGNASSATKLQTARTIWGQSFDGTENISGVLSGVSAVITSGEYGIYKASSFTGGLTANDIVYYANIHSFYGGNVGIGTANPLYKLDVNGAISTSTELIVNGSQIKYDSTKKYWKLEGDLLVTGGITMYGNEGTYTPSTIMDAIAVDGVTISKSGGVLKVIGGTGGGGLDITALQNYLTQNSYLNVTSGDNRYLKLSGGTLTSSSVPLYLDRTDSNSYTLIGYRNTSKDLGYFGFSNYGDLVVSPNRQNGNTNYYVIWHEGNFNPSNYLHLSSGGTITGNVTLKAALYGESYISWKDPETTEGGYFYGTSFNASKNYTWTSILLNWNVDTGVINFRKTPTVNGDSVWHRGNDGHNSGLDADTLDGYHSTILMSYVKGSGYVQANLLNSELWNIAGGDGYIEYYDNGTWFNSRWGKVTAHYGFEGSLSGNASSATKLQNSRTIWGRAFDGTSDITGSLYITNNNAIYIKDTSENWLNQIEVSSSNSFNLGYSSGGRGYSTFLYGGDITLKAGVSRVTSLYIDSNCNAVYNGMFTIKRAAQVPLYVHNSSGSDVCLRFVSQDVYRASLGARSGDYLLRFNSDLSASYKIWDEGNDGHGSGLDADTLDGYHSNAFMNFTSNASYVGASMGNETLSKLAGGNGYIEFWDGAGGWFNFRCGYVKSFSSMYIASALFLGDGGEGIYLHGTGVSWHNSSNTWTKSIMYINSNGDVCIGNQQPSARLHVLGDILATGGITMYSMRALKNVVDEKGLSLSELSIIKPTRYTWKDGRDNRLHIGGIADDIQQVLPEVVYSTSDGILTMDYGNAAFAVASSLIKPVIDHEKRIAMLEEENKHLRQEVERLKSA